MKNIKIAVFVSFVFPILFFSCKKEEQGTVEEIYSLEFFSEVRLNDVFDVFLTQDTVYSIKIVGDDKVEAQVEYEIENGVLILSNNFKPKWLNPKNNKVKLYISANRLKKVTAGQTCNIKTTNPIISDEFGIVFQSKMNQASLELDCNIFYYWNNFPCGGQLTLRGKSKTLKAWNFAIFSLDAKQLITDYALVENSSKGSCEINVKDKLEYSIKNTGNIYLHGNPSEVSLKEKTSSGELILLN